MNARKPQKTSADSSGDTLSHGRDLLLALSHVTQSIHKARTADDFYQIVGREIKSLGGEVTLLMMNDDNRSLTAIYTSYAPSLLRRIEKLTGKSVFGYQLDFPPNSVYARNLAAGKTEYVHWTAELIAEALPQPIRLLAGQFIKILKFDDSILAPLLVDDDTLGLMLVSGSFLNENDVPVLETFAGQIAIGLRNVRLLQKLQDELAARRHVEEDLHVSQATFEGIFNSLTEAIYILSERGVFIKVNHGAEIMYGYPLEYFVGRTPEFLSAPGKNDLARVVEFIHEAYLGRTVEFEFWGLRKDGSIFPKDVRLSPGIYFGEKVVIAVGRDITERRQAEEAIKKSEAQYRLLADHTIDTIWLVDMNLKTTYISPSVEKIRGFTLEQIQELPLDRNLTPGSLQLAMELIADELSKVQADLSYSPLKTVEMEFLNQDGSIYSTETKLSVIRDEAGNPISILGESRDIADRKRIEKALLESERYYRALIENAPDGILVVNIDGTIRYESPAVARVLGYAPNSLVGTSAFDLIFPGDLDQIANAFMVGLGTPGFIHRGEYHLRHSSGEWCDFEIVSHYLMEDPVINGIIINGHDITERKEIEAKLHLQSAALEAAANTIIITDHDGIIQWANSAFTSLTGFDSTEAIGKKPKDLLKSGQQSPQFYSELWDTILSGKTWHNELVNRRKDGSLYFEEMTITPLRNFEGEISHFIAIKQDITERKHAEEALIRSEQAYRTLFENMPIGLYRTSMDGHILDANQALVNMFGYPDRPSLFKMKTEDLYVSPASNIGFREGAVEKDGHFIFEVEFRRYDQQTFWAEDNFHIVYDKDGSPLYYEGSLIDITNRKHAEEELLRATQSLEAAHRELQQTLASEQLLARTDGLTGLYNRRYFHELAAREFIAAIRYQRPLTIMLFDLDGLKQINDTFGHEMGDTFLMQVAEIASAQVRNVDVLARYGGDEFIILFPQTNARDAYLFAERFRTTIETVKMATSGDPLSATISAGIAEIDHAHLNKSVEDTIRFADQALYKAKQKGKNCIEIYAPGANED